MRVEAADTRSSDALIARVLVAKPELTPDVLRPIIPRLDHLDDHALTQKIAYLKRKGAPTKRVTR